MLNINKNIYKFQSNFLAYSKYFNLSFSILNYFIYINQILLDTSLTFSSIFYNLYSSIHSFSTECLKFK